MNKILIIDDDNGVRESLSYHFEDCGYSVTTVISAEEAGKKIISEDYNVAIVDLRLPNLRGDDFIRSIYEQSPSTFFIIYTGSEEYTLPKEFLNLTRVCKKIFYKPLRDLYTLNKTIEDYLGSK